MDFCTLTIEALIRAGKQPVNFSKSATVLQKPDESLESFLEQLIEAYEQYA